jgi:hypothetical protein
MKDPARAVRIALVGCLVLAPVLMLVSSVLQPPFETRHVDRLAALDDAGSAPWISNVLFVSTQAPMLVALLGIAHLISGRSPRLAVLGGGLAVVATFAEATMGGTGLVYLTMAADAENRGLFAGVWEQMESSPVMVFAMLGFGGTVLTLILLSVGLFRSRVAPPWVPVLVGLFLVLEFFGSAVTEYASYVAALCLLIAFGAVARLVLSTPVVDASTSPDVPQHVTA